MGLSPPPDNTSYASFEDLFAATIKHAGEHGYAITIKRSKNNKKGERRKVILRCDKGGKFNSKSHGKRSTFSRQSECPFELIARRDPVLKIWSFEIKNPDHNHLTTIAGSHPAHRKRALTWEIKNSIVNQSRIHATAKQILTILPLDGDETNPLFKPQDVYNFQISRRMEILGPLTPIQALMQELAHRDDWSMRYTADESDRITRLFFSKNTSHRMLRLNHEVLTAQVD